MPKGDIPALAGAYARLIEASGGGALGLFTAVRRLRAVYGRIADRLVSIEGVAHKADNTLGAPLTVSGSPVELAPNRMAVLTEGETFSVSSPDLQPGLVVDLTLTFESGASATAKAPVMSYDDPIYGSISPSPGRMGTSPLTSAPRGGCRPARGPHGERFP